eukprot:m.311298 g.311298  ORF g.311298 m.311298 type:complete len:621 (+) comp64564_c0_seq1:82-1944(+)
MASALSESPSARRMPKDDSAEEKLLYACRYGIVSEVDAILAKHKAGKEQVDIEYASVVVFEGERDVEGATPLWSAATAGHVKVVQSLLRAGANVNHSTTSNSTPLRGACFDGHLVVVKELLEAGAKPNVGNRLNQTPLMIASGRGHAQVVEYLLKWGVDVNVVSVTGDTALHAAAEKGCLDIVKLLLENEAKPEMVTLEGWTASILSAASRYDSVVQLLINLPSTQPNEYANALELLGAEWADMDGDTSKARDLWSQALQYRETHTEPKTNLVPRCKTYWNRAEIASMDELDTNLLTLEDFLTMGLLMRERILGPKHPQTPHYLRIRGDECLQLGDYEHALLLWERAIGMDQHADIDALDLNSASTIAQNILICLTGLQKMKEQGHWPSLKMFVLWALNCIRSALKSGANVKELLAATLIALGMWATWGKKSPEDGVDRMSAIQELLALGPIGGDKLLPLHCVCSERLIKMWKKLPFVRLNDMHAFPSPCLVKKFLRNGAKVNSREPLKGDTPLHWLSRSAMEQEHHLELHETVLELLLKNGAHVDIRNRDDQAAIVWLGSREHEQVPQLMANSVQKFVGVLRLECLAARVIAESRQNICSSLPVRFHRFVQLHACFAQQ